MLFCTRRNCCCSLLFCPFYGLFLSLNDRFIIISPNLSSFEGLLISVHFSQLNPQESSKFSFKIYPSLQFSLWFYVKGTRFYDILFYFMPACHFIQPIYPIAIIWFYLVKFTLLFCCMECSHLYIVSACGVLVILPLLLLKKFAHLISWLCSFHPLISCNAWLTKCCPACSSST